MFLAKLPLISYHKFEMSKINLEAVVYKEVKYHVAQCLNVDVSSFGKTEKEALDNLKEALELYFEDQKPSDITPVKEPRAVSLALQGV